ncbi:hypothetical protein OROHE_015742 [Orobanche hederae]
MLFLDAAAQTKCYTGAELEGVVKSAVSYALNRKLNVENLKPVEEENIKVSMEDFLNASKEMVSAFGASTYDLERCRIFKIVDCGKRHDLVYQSTMLLAKQVKVSERSPLVTCLLQGPSGSGKTAMAATVGIESDFPCVKIISAETVIGLSEHAKCAKIIEAFQDAYRFPISIIILNDIERLLEYVAIGNYFSKSIYKTLLVLLKQLPPKGERVLEQLDVFFKDHVYRAACELDNGSLKKLYTAAEMAAHGKHGGHAEDVYSVEEKISLMYFYECLEGMRRK